jgi:tetratricopeptide (TPR) repeat protein
MASALFAALASAMMTLTVIEAILISSLPKRISPSGKRGGKNKAAEKKRDKNANVAAADEATNSVLIVTLVPAIIAGLLFALSRTLWAYATIAEVYTLNALLIMTVFWLMLGWRRGRLIGNAEESATPYRKLYIAAFIFGLALGVHHVTVALMLPALAVLVFSTEGKAFFLSRRFLYAALISFAGLSIYIYLPLAASQSPLFNWGDPSTLERFWWHISGKQYLVFFNFSFARISEFLTLASREFGSAWLPVALIAAALGFITLFRRERTMFWFLLLVFAASLAYCLSYEIADDKDAYYIPAFIALTIAAAFGVHWMITAAQNQTKVPLLTAGRVGIAMLIIPVVSMLSNYAVSDRSRYFIARDYVENVLRSVEPGGLVLTGDWQLYSPSLYVRDIVGERKDTTIIDVRLLRRSWYFNYLDQAYPQLAEASRGEINMFLEDLSGFDRNADIYEKNIAMNARINERFETLISSLITNHLRSGNVYVTLELAAGGGQEPGLKKALGDKYELIPEGIVFRISEKAAPKDIKVPDLELRGLHDGTVKFGEDDVAKRTVIPIYVNMLTNTGSYLASKGQYQKAIKLFNQALAIEPTFEPAKRSLAAARNSVPR